MGYNIASIGAVVILIGFALVVIGALSSASAKDTKVAVGGFIGFIPFGFSNDKKLLWALIGLIALFFVYTVVMNFLIYARVK